MAHVDALKREELADLEGVLAMAEQTMGFVPNSMLTMARMPQLTMAFSMLAGVVFGGDLKAIVANYADSPTGIPQDPHAASALSPDLVQLIAYCVSLSAGCRYCQAHTSHNASRFGIDSERLRDVLNYADSDRFDDRERALIAMALAAGQVPNEAGPEHFSALRQHFDERQITQIVAVIALFGFLNRWNDTMATQLEEQPVSFAQEELGAAGWQLGKHG